MTHFLNEITTLRAEVRALTELASGREPVAKFECVSMKKTSEAFEEVQEQLHIFGIEIQMPAWDASRTKLHSIAMDKTGDVFEELEDRLKTFGVEIQMPTET